MARPQWHLLAALPMSGVALLRHGRGAAAFLGVSVLYDVDYLLDWALNGGREDYSNRLIRLLHGWEFPLLFVLAARFGGAQSGSAAQMASLGTVCHLTLDQLVHCDDGIRHFSTIYRMTTRFRSGTQGTHARRRPRAWQLTVAAVIPLLVYLLFHASSRADARELTR